MFGKINCRIAAQDREILRKTLEEIKIQKRFVKAMMTMVNYSMYVKSYLYIRCHCTLEKKYVNSQ